MTNSPYSNATYSNTHLTFGYADNSGWLWRFVGTTHEDEADGARGFQKLTTASGKLDDTRDLLEVLLTYAPGDYDLSDLPTWGTGPEYTTDVYSWDATHVIVGCSVQGLTRRARLTGRS